MSVFICRSFPYMIQQAAMYVQDYEISQIVDYIEQIIHPNSNVTDIKVSIEWKYVNDSSDSNDSDSSDSNHSDSSDNSNVDFKFIFSDDEEHSSYEHDTDDDEKDDILLSDNDENINNIDNIDINKIDFGKIKKNIHESRKPIGIDYKYTYQIDNNDNDLTFDNNDNIANVLYSRTLNLAVMFDHALSMRNIFSVFTTLKWDKKDYTRTPPDILRSQLWGRSAIYKAHLLGPYLLHDYTYLLAGVGGYMLEAYWYYNPYGFGFFQVCQQMCEHFGSWMKKDRNFCGSGNSENFLYEIAKNHDLSVLARIYYDQVCFKTESYIQQSKNISIRTFDLSTNSRIATNVLQESPILLSMYSSTLKQIQVNQNIPKYITDINNLDSSEYSNIRAGMQEHIAQMMKHNLQNVDKLDSLPKNQASKWRSRLRQAKQIKKNIKKSTMSTIINK